MTTKTTRMKGPKVEWHKCDARYPGIKYLVTKEGQKILYASYTSRVDGKQHLEKVGVWGKGDDKWTPAKAAAERLARINGNSKTNAERREEAKATAEANARAAQEKAATAESTFKKYAIDWLDRMRAKGRKPSTLRDYKSSLDVHIFPVIGDRPIAEITHKDLDDLVTKKLADTRTGRKPGQEVISGKRINNILAPVKTIFKDAVKRGDIEKNPAALLGRVTEDKPEIAPLNFDEVAKFLNAVDPRYRAYFGVAFATGMRVNELIGLKWTNVSFTLRKIHVREGRVQGEDGPPKTKSSIRDIDIRPALLRVLKAHRNDNPDATFVFTSPEGSPLQVDNIRNRAWTPALLKAGIKVRNLKETRHTFASLMLQIGEDPAWIARTLGHTDLSMLYKVYGKFVQQDREYGLAFDGALDAATAKALPAQAEVDAVTVS